MTRENGILEAIEVSSLVADMRIERIRAANRELSRREVGAKILAEDVRRPLDGEDRDLATTRRLV